MHSGIAEGGELSVVPVSDFCGVLLFLQGDLGQASEHFNSFHIYFSHKLARGVFVQN